jgi:hypothetical protein
VLGALGLLFDLVAAASHYIFGAPIHLAHSGGKLMSPQDIVRGLSVLGLGFSILFLVGLWGFRRS